jgi:chromate transporter
MTIDIEDPVRLPYDLLTLQQQRQRLRELAKVFFRLGLTAFGGPAAHIALMDHEVVERRQWMSRTQLLDLLGITNLIPGPNSSELAIHIGYERGGWRGLWIAGGCFILPAMLMVWGLAALYQRYQTVPQMEWLLYGIKPVIIAIVVQALVKLGQKAIKDQWTLCATLLAIAGYLGHWPELLILLLLGLLVMAIKRGLSQSWGIGFLLWPLPGLLTPTSNPALNSVSWLGVFFFFLKIGSILYGSGYVLLAFLQRELVEQHHWLTSQQLLDAVAIGQITPGPVFTTATFVGYLLAGNAGAIAGTVGIFLPAFALVWLVHPWVAKLRQSLWVSGFLDGINSASLGLMAGVTYTLAQETLQDGLTLGLAIISSIILFLFPINTAWLVLGGGLVGLAVRVWN